MNRVQLIIGSYPNQISLDLDSNAISIALQYSIDDVRDIDKKNSNHSKTITLPGTKKNNDAFGNLFDVNSTFDRFNPNKKVIARIVSNSSPILEGYLQLTNVNKLNNADLQGNKISYNVIVFDDSIDFIQTLGDSTLSDLDLSAFNHIYNEENITNAWSAHTYSDIYQYPLMDKTTRGYFTTDFKPAFYHKGLLLKIAEEAGYTLTGSFIESNKTYEQEIIMWDGETPLISDSEALTREFNAGFTGDTLSYDVALLSSLRTIDSLNLERNANFNDLNSPNFDNTGNYTFDNPDALGPFNQWVSANKSKFNFKSRLKTELTFTGKGIPSINGSRIEVFTYIRAKLVSNIQGNLSSSYVKIGLCPDITSYDPATPSSSASIDVDATFDFENINLEVGEEVKLFYDIISSPSSTDPIGDNTTFVSYEIDNNFGGSPSDYSITPVTIDWNIYKTMNNGNLSYFKNETVKDDNFQDGDQITLNAFIPKEFKQKDLLSDIIRRYNVYVRKHPIDTKTLILETRDDFYANDVTVLDWTQKKDYSSEDNIAFLSDLQNKEILFTYKEDNSAVDGGGGKRNESYFGSTGDIYGQKKVNFDNDFVSSTQEITSFFSSAPLLYRGDEHTKNYVVVPAVSSSEGKRNPVLCYYGGMVPVKDKDDVSQILYTVWGDTGNTPTQYTEYPYAGHYDNPYDPTLDIHYGEVTYEYYGTLLNDFTDNNLFNNYWRNYINQISNGKLVTSKFYLTETDINFVKDHLNSRIFVKDSYYVINKITDYKPLEDGLTTVELLRIEEGSTFEPTETPVTEVPSSVVFTTADQFQDSLSTLTSNSYGPFRSNVSNNVNTPNAMVIGNDNYVGGGTTGIVNGDNNNVGGGTTGVSVQGNNNVVAAGANNVTIVGEGVTVTEANTTVLGALTINSDGEMTVEGKTTFKTYDSLVAAIDIPNLPGMSYTFITPLDLTSEIGNIVDVSIMISGAPDEITRPLNYFDIGGTNTVGGQYGINEVTGEINIQFNPSGIFNNVNYTFGIIRLHVNYFTA